MSSLDIRKNLLDLNLSEAAIARDGGVSRQMVQAVISGRSATPWVRRLIAEKLGMTYLRVWGVPDPGTPAGVRADAKPTALVCRVKQHADKGASEVPPCAA